MTTLHLDLESRSVAHDLPRIGAYNYARHPTTRVWVAAWALDDEPVQAWHPGTMLPAALHDALADPEVRLAAHNAAFEHLMINYNLAPLEGWPEVAPERWVCTAAKAAAHALPRDLARAAKALGLPEEKDAGGRRLMLQMAKPRRLDKSCPGCHGTGIAPGGYFGQEEATLCHCVAWWDDSERLARLTDYCITDVEVERAIDRALADLSTVEQAIFLEDFRSNLRGVQLDEELVKAAQAVNEYASAAADRQMQALTDGAVPAVSNTGALVQWLQSLGVDTKSVAKAVVVELLADPALPAKARPALELRQSAGKSSTAKLAAYQARVSPDGRMRELVLYQGAMPTARWAGRGPQLQNLPRPELGPTAAEQVISILQQNYLSVGEQARQLEFLFPSVAVALAEILRGCVIAAPGNRLLVADYSNIEGRIVAWLGNELWKLDAFRAYDAGTGPDLYKVAAAGVFGLTPEEITGLLRQIGKVLELSMGYQGGVGAFLQMAGNYGMKIGDYYEIIMAAIDEALQEAAREAWTTFGSQAGVPQRTWLAAETVKRAWRARHPGIVASWFGAEEAAISAMQDPGREYTSGRLVFHRQPGGMFLTCKLPSGRRMCYPEPRLEAFKTPWGATKHGLTAMTLDSMTNRYLRRPIYGGLLVQNATQGLARDLLAAAWLRVARAGYPVVLTVHDEILAERLLREGSYAEFAALMARVPRWAEGIPLAVSGFEATRYRGG